MTPNRPTLFGLPIVVDETMTTPEIRFARVRLVDDDGRPILPPVRPACALCDGLGWQVGEWDVEIGGRMVRAYIRRCACRESRT